MTERRFKARIIPGFLYLLLIVYGTLYPFHGWDTSHWRLPGWPHHVPRSDAATNVLVYIPLGFLVVRWFSAKFGRTAKLILVTMLGIGLSFTLECLQGFLPGRVPSLVDVLLNGIGTMTGATLALYAGRGSPWGEKLLSLRREWILPGRLYDLGLWVLGLWACSQLAPFVPSLDVGNLKQGVRPLWDFVHDPSRFSLYGAAAYSLYIASLGVVAATVARAGARALPVFWIFFAGVLFLKIPMVGRQLSPEALAGLGIGAAFCAMLLRLPRPWPLFLAVAALLAGFTLNELQPEPSLDAGERQFNWAPFRGQMQNIIGFADILEGVWPFSAMAYLMALTFPDRRRTVMIAGGVSLLIPVFILEWAQQAIPGRSPDVTDVMLALAGWTVPLLLVNEHME